MRLLNRLFTPSLARVFVIVVTAGFACTVEAGWHHRYAAGCGSCGSHRHHRWHGSSGGSHGSSGGGSHGSAGGSASAATPAAPAAAADKAPAATPDKKAESDAPKPLLVGATTRLTLRVPADAKVWIEGQLTSSTGEIREFGTQSLADGQAWENYEVRVVTLVDGREVETVRRLTLKGGSDLDLAINPRAMSPDIQATASVE